MKLIYISKYSDTPVINSQVIELINYFQHSGMFTQITFIAGIKYNDKNINSIERLLDENINIYYFKNYPNYPIFDKLTINSLKHTISKIKDLEECVIHVRSDTMTYYTFSALKKLSLNTNHIIADIRGAISKEIEEYSSKNVLFKFLKLHLIDQSSKALHNIKNISTVSSSLKTYISKFIDDFHTDIHVNSCIAANEFTYNSKTRNSIRKNLGLSNDDILIILVTGGNSKWQNTENTIENLCKHYKILNLSKTKMSHHNVINKFVPYTKVHQYLCAADVAIIWREASMTNKVASPIKFSEYIACGLPVVTNKNIDLINEYITKNKCGVILNSLDEIDDNLFIALKALDRYSISRKGIENFGISSISMQYINLYKSVTK